MVLGYTPEFPPLLAPGRHLLSLSDLQVQCLDPFEAPTTRDQILAAIELLVGDLTQWGVRCELWIAGDFVTRNPDPEVANIAVVILQEAYDIIDVHLKNDILGNMDQRSYSDRLDLVAVEAKSRADPDRETTESFLTDWVAVWQVGPSGWIRGMAVMQLGETNVGIRLLS
jgi:hypothetical protein